MNAPEISPPVPARSRRRIVALWAGAVVSLGACVALLVVAVTAALATGPTASKPPDTAPAPLGANTPAPPFDLPRLGGSGVVTLAGRNGRPVILNFFASWCTDCQAELSAFAVASRRLAGRVEFIGIDTHETDTAAALAQVRRAGDAYRIGVDQTTSAGQTIADLYLVGALPETFFIDAAGRVESFVPGRETVSGLLDGARALLRQASNTAGG